MRAEPRACAARVQRLIFIYAVSCAPHARCAKDARRARRGERDYMRHVPVQRVLICNTAVKVTRSCPGALCANGHDVKCSSSAGAARRGAWRGVTRYVRAQSVRCSKRAGASPQSQRYAAVYCTLRKAAIACTRWRAAAHRSRACGEEGRHERQAPVARSVAERSRDGSSRRLRRCVRCRRDGGALDVTRCAHLPMRRASAGGSRCKR